MTSNCNTLNLGISMSFSAENTAHWHNWSYFPAVGLLEKIAKICHIFQQIFTHILEGNLFEKYLRGTENNMGLMMFLLVPNTSNPDDQTWVEQRHVIWRESQTLCAPLSASQAGNTFGPLLFCQSPLINLLWGSLFSAMISIWRVSE